MIRGVAAEIKTMNERDSKKGRGGYNKSLKDDRLRGRIRN